MKQSTNKSTKKDFIKKHPILFHLGLIIATGSILVWIALLALDAWTEHGVYRVVPNLKGMSYEQATIALRAAELQAELSDSIYDSSTRPGCVVEQSPKHDTKVKRNRTVYLTINATTPRMITIPAITDVSIRQARSILYGLGIKKIVETTVESDYKDLVLAAKFNGVTLRPGTRVPASATITLEIGAGRPEIVDSTAVDPTMTSEEIIASELDLL